MAARFYSDISTDERSEWRKHPVTELAMSMLREHQSEAAREVLSGSPRRTPEETSYELGYHAAVQECIELLEQE